MDKKSVSRSFTVSVIQDGVTYWIESNVGSIRFGGSVSTKTQSVTVACKQREGGGSDAAYPCYWAFYVRTGTTYARKATNTKASSVTKSLSSIPSTADAVVVFALSSAISTTTAPTGKMPPAYVARLEIPISKDGADGKGSLIRGRALAVIDIDYSMDGCGAEDLTIDGFLDDAVDIVEDGDVVLYNYDQQSDLAVYSASDEVFYDDHDGASEGDCYIGMDGHLWQRDGSIDSSIGRWRDMGQFKGDPGDPGAAAEWYELRIQGGYTSVDFSADYAGAVSGRPSQVTLLLIHHTGGDAEELAATPAGMTLEHLLDDGTWETIAPGARNTENDLSDGTYDTAYRLRKGSGLVCPMASLAARWVHQRMLLPQGRWSAAKRYARTGTTTPLVLYATEDGGDGRYYFLNSDTASGSTGANAPAMSGSYWALATDLDVVLTRMLFAQFAQLGGFIVYDAFFFSRYGTLVAASGAETAIDSEAKALAVHAGQKAGVAFEGVAYGWFDPADPMPAGAHAATTTYRFRPAKCINGATGEEWAAGGSAHFSPEGGLSVSGTIKAVNLYRTIALSWGGFNIRLLDTGGATRMMLYVKALDRTASPALAAKYGFSIGDYVELTEAMYTDDGGDFDDGMNNLDFGDNDFVPCTYNADVVELLDRPSRSAYWPANAADAYVYLPLPADFAGKMVEVRHNITGGAATAYVTTVTRGADLFALYAEIDANNTLRTMGYSQSQQVTINAGKIAKFYSTGSQWLLLGVEN